MAYEWWCLRPNGWQTPVVKDVSKINGDLPPWHVPDVPWDEWDTWKKSLPIAASLAAIGLVESVLTLQAVDQILDEQTPVWKKNQECFAQGLANLTSGFFKAMGGDAMIGQSTINVLNGAKGRLSAFIAAAFMLLHIVVLGDFIEAVPTAALAGILFVVVLHTFNWSSLAIIFRRALPIYMCVTIVLVTVLSVLTNLAIGIGVGILWESIIFVWREGSRLDVTPFESENLKTYRVEGSLFFANTDSFNEHFTPQADPKNVVVDLANSRVLDFSALYSLNVLGKRYEKVSKRFLIRMKDEDYKRYVDICDDKHMVADSKLRRYLPTKAVTSIHGHVSRAQMLPRTYQEFEPLPLRAHSKVAAALPEQGAEPEGGLREVMVAVAKEEDPGQSEVPTSSKRPLSSAPVKVPLVVTDIGPDPVHTGAEPSPPPSAEAELLMPQVQSPLVPGTPESAKTKPRPPGGPSGDSTDTVLPGMPMEREASNGSAGDEDDKSWASEESV